MEVFIDVKRKGFIFTEITFKKVWRFFLCWLLKRSYLLIPDHWNISESDFLIMNKWSSRQKND